MTVRTIIALKCAEALALRLWPREARAPDRQVWLDGLEPQPCVVPPTVESVLIVSMPQRKGNPFAVWIDPDAVRRA